MHTLRSKSEIKHHLDKVIEVYRAGSSMSATEYLSNNVFNCKCRFPLLEYAAEILFENIPFDQQLAICDQVEATQTLGGWVITGKILQLRLKTDFIQSVRYAEKYISKADEWYICDIIGERVWGKALLIDFNCALAEYIRMHNEENRWVVRATGAGAHHSLKHKLPPKNAERHFQLLLKKSLHKDKEIRQGIGWAAKTTAKFHPEIIRRYEHIISDESKTAGWFRTKVKIGLARNYALSNRSKIGTQ